MHRIPTLLERTVDCISEKLIEEKIQKGKPLKIKAGFDPTSKDLHLGHTVILHFLKEWQELGHTIQFVIGDYTAQIGDPSGKNKTRPPLALDAIKAHAETYQKQAFKVLDPEQTEIHYNSTWCNPLSAKDLITLASSQTVARMLERDDFSKRYKNQQSIAIHEFLYPLIQGYDSVILESDIEVGGTDQIFNLLMGRDAQRQAGKTEQAVLTLPLLEGTDGIQKMSKSLDNAIGIDEPPEEIFGKIMSISDTLMWRYYDLLSFTPQGQAHQACLDGENPRDRKMALAFELVERFYNTAKANHAQSAFIEQFRNRNTPEDIPEHQIQTKEIQLTQAIKEVGLVSSTSEGMRMIKQGAVKIDGEKVSENLMLTPKDPPYMIQVGKRRFARISITN